MTLRTVWSRDALSDVPLEYQGLERWVFPGIYGLAFAVIGILGTLTGGTRQMQAYLTPLGAQALCIVIGASALLAFIGIALRTPRAPRRSRSLERNGAGLLMSATGLYAIVLVLSFASGDNGPPPFTTITMTAAFSVISWYRIRYLSREIGRLKKAEART